MPNFTPIVRPQQATIETCSQNAGNHDGKNRERLFFSRNVNQNTEANRLSICQWIYMYTINCMRRRRSRQVLVNSRHLYAYLHSGGKQRFAISGVKICIHVRNNDVTRNDQSCLQA